MKRKQRGLTIVDVVVLMLLLAVLASVVWPALSRPREEICHMKCKNNLRQLGTGMIQYIDQYGKGKYYTWPGTQTPNFNGAQWIASMYWTALLNEPDIYLCPDSKDENDSGGRLGRRFTGLGPGDVSYAGRNGMMGAIVDKMPSNTLMMSDDSEGEPNHEDGMNLLFFDAHWEFTDRVFPGDIGFKKPVDMLRN